MVCLHSFKKFIKLNRKDLLCPFCGSRSRTRRLKKILQDESLLQGKILHFSPSRSLYRILKKNNDITYFSTDYENEFIAEYNYDITNIPVQDDFFDLIICYHILEHIPNDEKAMAELYRVLKPKGICLIQTPFKKGDIYEDETIKSPADRLHAFGQEDHVRIYSVEGLTKRLVKNNFEKVTAKDFVEENHYGFQNETIIFAVK